MKKKLLFLIHDLGQGGAEKVLVNLVNNMDRRKFDITVMALFGGGVNAQFLHRDIRLITCHKKPFRGNSHLMKLFSPRQLYRHYIREHYDIAVSYLEGPSARIISGCPDADTKLAVWIHGTLGTEKALSAAFRSVEEARRCYRRFDRRIFVSADVEKVFRSVCPDAGACQVLYNVNESDRILHAGEETVEPGLFTQPGFTICGTGKVTANKGFDRLLRIHQRLRAEGYPVYTYILGDGAERAKLQSFIDKNGLDGTAKLLGYQTNPYKYVKKCSLFVCSSHSEGFSTAATEALILGTPVCTAEVSGMKEMLGEHNEYGIVTENDEEALYRGIKRLLDDPALLAHYKEKAAERGKTFRTENTVRAVEEMLESL